MSDQAVSSTVHEAIGRAMLIRGIAGVVLSSEQAADMFDALVNWAGACPQHHKEAIRLLSLLATKDTVAAVDDALRRMRAP